MGSCREWMYNRTKGKYLSKVFIEKVDGFIKVFIEKVDGFIKFSCALEEFQRCHQLKFPYAKCRNVPYLDVDTIKLHLYQRGFRANYYRWVCHGEPFLGEDEAATSSSIAQVIPNPMRDMMIDAYVPTASLLLQELLHQEEREPIPEAKRFLELLKAAERPLYEGCAMSLLKAIARLTNLKCEYNLPHQAIDGLRHL